MGKLRHIAFSVPDQWKAAEFYMKAFELRKVGETDNPLALGVFLTDGVINIALVKFRSEEAAGGGTTRFPSQLDVPLVPVLASNAVPERAVVLEYGEQMVLAVFPDPVPPGVAAQRPHTNPVSAHKESGPAPGRAAGEPAPGNV